jgi:transposase
VAQRTASDLRRRTDRPVRVSRLDLVAKHWAAVLLLVKLEPLKEPVSSHYKKESTMTAQKEPHYVGLDIAKAQLDYAVTDTVAGRIANDPPGHASLIALLQKLARPRVVCEASGGYERPVVAALLAAGLEVCVVQPGRVRAFAHAEGTLAKTDRIDAQLLRRFGQSVPPRLAVPADPASALLRDLRDRRRNLIGRLVEVENQLATARPALRRWLEREQRFLTRERTAIEAAITRHLAEEPTLRQKSARLQQLKGVGPILAATLLGHVPELGTLPDATVSSLVGLAPHARDSGNTRMPRHIRGGRGPVRHVLYMAAVSAIRSNPILREFYQRLRARGKPARVGLVAVMRKMLTVLNRLLADPNFCLAG